MFLTFVGANTARNFYITKPWNAESNQDNARRVPPNAELITPKTEMVCSKGSEREAKQREDNGAISERIVQEEIHNTGRKGIRGKSGLCAK